MLKMIWVPPADSLKQEEGSFVEVESTVEYKLAIDTIS